MLITTSIKQKNIISKNVTGLNDFTAEQLLYAMKYKCHCNLMLDVANKLAVILTFWSHLKLSFWEYGWDREYEADAECTLECTLDNDSDGKI